MRPLVAHCHLGLGKLTDKILVRIITIGLLWLATDRWLLRPLERWTIERWGLVTS
jgi:NitT/TauT family transport system permease protein/taurine transport system permease protein